MRSLASKFCQLAVALLLGNAVSAQDDYFQQHVAYDIKVELDDSNHIIRGFEELDYTNNSPDELTFLYFHLWPNAYSHRTKTHLALQLIRIGELNLYNAQDDELGYIKDLDFKVNGNSIDWIIPEDTLDICKLILPEPLKPGETIKITTPFTVKYPSGKISRLGHIGESYQTTQWYPKPAVYDRFGWHQMPYLTQGEFFSEFGSYDVYITLPENYVVGATGDLQNQEEIAWLNEKVDSTERWISERKKEGSWPKLTLKNSFPASSSKTKTLHYRQDKVHDFAWFADKRYHVLKGKVELPHSKDSVDVWTMFTSKEAKLWAESIEYMQDAIYYYSLWNGDYPYRHATAVDGTISAGGGMEYPNVTVIGGAGNALSLELVIMHEVGHNWFYGILGSNERDHPWMDEGLNTYNEQRYLTTKYPDGMLLSKDKESGPLEFIGADRYEMKAQHYLTYLVMARRNLDQPLNEESDDFTMLNYGAMVYSKTGIMFNYLRHYLGDSLMDACMSAYFEAYKFKHPYPEDVKRVFVETTGQNLDWFFDHLLTDRRKIDFRIASVKKVEDGKLEVKIKNLSGIALPVCVGELNADRDKITWIRPFESDTTVQVSFTKGEIIALDPNMVIPEVRREDNYYETTGLFRKVGDLDPDFLFELEEPWTNQLLWAPSLNYNRPSGFMLGLTFYNSLAPVKRFNYRIAPMFSFADQDVYGAYNLWYGITPEKTVFQNIDIGVEGRRFGYGQFNRGQEDFALSFVRIKPYVKINLKPKSYTSKFRHYFEFNQLFVGEELAQIDDVNAPTYSEELSFQGFLRSTYGIDYKSPIIPWNLEISTENTDLYNKAFAEFKGRYEHKEAFTIDFNLFLGAMLNADAATPQNYYFQVAGRNPMNDYAYDGYILDREMASEAGWRQFERVEGGAVNPLLGSLFTRNEWMSSLQLDFKKDGLPIGVYTTTGIASVDDFYFDSGLSVRIGRDFFVIYAPVFASNSTASNLIFSDFKWHDHIRFSINLNRINLFDYARDLSFI